METPDWIVDHHNRMRESFINRGLPDYMWEGLRLYVMEGIPPGHFLTRALENSLIGAFSYADEANRASMHGWVMLFYNDLPTGCWGNTEKVHKWIERGGLLGIDAEAEGD